MSVHLEAYAPQDAMALWWLGQTQGRPLLVGQLHLAAGRRKVALQYDPAWLARGFALSPDLPLQPGAFLPAERNTAAGAVDDARPDRWGEQLIRALYRPGRLSVLELLYFGAPSRFGALGVCLGAGRYRPGGIASAGVRSCSAAALAALQRATAAVRAGEPLSPPQARLLAPGASFGGAQPKGLLAMEGAQWLVKFYPDQVIDTALVEHATLCLAARCGIEVAFTRALPLPGGAHALAARRFDRLGAQRLHVLSGATVLRACSAPPGYPALAQSLRRLAPARAIRAQQREVFCRMVFNILVDNTDDHEKNHALVRGAGGFYALAPAYDVLPSGQALGCQQLQVGRQGADACLENALTEVHAFGLTKDAASQLIRGIVAEVNGWQAHFAALGVKARDLERLAACIDGAHLKAQRAAFSQRISYFAGLRSV